MAVYTPVIRLPPKRKPSLVYNNNNSFEIFEPTDCLVSDTLFLSTLPKNVRESDIRTLLQHCMPIEIVIDREKDIGHLRFSSPKYADRAYTLYNGFTFTNNTKLQLQMYQDSKLDPEATAGLLEINGLPEYYDENKLFDLCRPFGPLNLIKCTLLNGIFRGTAFVQFFDQYSFEDAQRNLNGRLLDGYKLSVVPYMPSKTHTNQHQQQQEETEQDNNNNNGPVDIMNLYIKNLEPHITNNDLTQIFRKFGRIVSARVMTNPQTGQSKGYGFVSYNSSEEAAAALQEMNGAMLGNRPLTVAYHEPKKGRQATNNNYINSNHNGDSYNSNNNTNHNNHNNNYNHHHQQQQYHNYNTSSTSSYYNNNNHNMNDQYSSSARSINSSNMVASSNNTPINGLGIDNVDELGMNMNLKDLSIGHKPTASHTTVNLPQRKASDAALNKLSSPQFSSSPISGTTSTGRSLASLASGLSIQQAPLQPQPVVNIGHNGRPTLRRRGSLESVMTESSANIQRLKLEDAVRTFGDYGKATGDIVDMLLTLKRKERSLCLFNPDFLKEKVNLALEALATCNETDSEDEDEEDEVDGLDMDFSMRSRLTATAAPFKKPALSPPLAQQAAYYSGINTRSSPVIQQSSPPLIRRESKAIPIVAPPAVTSTITTTPVTSSHSTSTSSSSLTKENLANNKAIKSESKRDVEALLSSFEGKPIHEQKQLLGDKLFPLVKSTGTRHSPKVTIYLLDTVDLHELANIMYDNTLLKQRVEEAYQSLQQQQ